MRKRQAFTLVELLVVIGIIALLIAILLPALTEARKQARTVKCAAHLREIGRAFLMYAHDNNGYYPVASWQRNSGPVQYELDGVLADTHIWNVFLAPYATTTRQGLTSGTDPDLATAARRSVFWGCPEWEGYRTTATGGYDRTGIGYGMNPHPIFDIDTPTNPSGTGFIYNVDQPGYRSPNNVRALIRGSGEEHGGTGKFMRASQWTRASERALVADSINWRIKAQPEPADGVLRPQPTPDRINTFRRGNKLGQTLVSLYRHGSAPSLLDATGDLYSANGGRIRYNIMYADGHVKTHNDWRPAFYSLRFGNPGN
jgi:prepilin-type N-terminal cleavage/methylation domain-containing protein/prepilin-type processing-associated H-X9-DG protein